MKRILLTGGRGYIGRYMPGDLHARGYEVHAISRERSGNAGDATWHAVDLLDAAATDALMARIGATHLVHLAWVTEHGRYWHSPLNQAWLDASTALLRSFAEHGGQRAVLAGTCAEYDDTQGPCVEDQTPLRARSLYAASKLALRQAAHDIAVNNALDLAWARVFFSFGPHEPAERLVPSVIRALLAGDRAKCGDASLLRDFTYVQDVAGALAAVLDSDFLGDINVGSGQAMTIERLVTRIAAKLDASDRVDFGYYPARPDDPQELTADVSRLTNTIGWAPEYDLDSAIERTIAWWRDRAA